MPDVRLEVDAGVGRITLDRPGAVNSLTTAMCAAINTALDAWATDPAVARVAVDGAGAKGLCAGGDVRAVRAAIVAGDPATAMEFFATEFAMNLRLATYPKPTAARQWGIVMGGGLGISAHCADRVVTPDARIAMPETIIGYFPDVGIRWYLARAPHHLGVHLALTGATVNGADAILLGLADRGDALPAPTLDPEAAWLACYAEPTGADVVRALEARPEVAAREAAAAIRERSPLSVCLALEAIRRAAGQDIATVLAGDLGLCRATMTNPDFAEGVRARLVDKDGAPRWRHARVEDVTAADVEAMFAA